LSKFSGKPPSSTTTPILRYQFIRFVSLFPFPVSVRIELLSSLPFPRFGDSLISSQQLASVTKYSLLAFPFTLRANNNATDALLSSFTEMFNIFT
jgi:hypothetical protein